MSSLRIARTVLRTRASAIRTPLQCRGYAEAVSDKVGSLHLGSEDYGWLTEADQTEPCFAASSTYII